MMPANTMPWWPPASRSPPACWRSCCRTWAFPRAPGPGWQIPIKTDGVHGAARIADIDGAELRKRMEQGQVAVIAGFQGIGPDHRITTLGRGGSDTSRGGRGGGARCACDIYTDVDGVYTADPRIVTSARKLDRISYEEMLEQASLGAKVLQTRSVELAMVYKVPLQVRSSFEPPDSPDQNKPDGTGPGTLVCDEERIVEQHVVSGIAYSRDEAKVSIRKVKDQPGVSASHLRPAGGGRHQRRHDRAEHLRRRRDRRYHLHAGRARICARRSKC